MKKPHAALHNLTELTLTSREVCQIARVTPRQLQWWDEHQVVCPDRSGHKRSYRFEDVLAILVAAEVRRKGLSLQKIRRVLRAFRREMGRSAGEVLAAQSEWFLITDGQSAHLENRHDGVINLLNDARRPMWLVSVSEQAERLWEFERKTRAQRARGRGKGSRSADKQLSLFA